MRREYPGLRKGDYQSVLTNDRTRVFAFARKLNGQTLIAVFNRNPNSNSIDIPLSNFRFRDSSVTELMSNQTLPVINGIVTLPDVEGLGFRVLLVQ
jgi:maltooligosyltrehalose synthase